MVTGHLFNCIVPSERHWRKSCSNIRYSDIGFYRATLCDRKIKIYSISWQQQWKPASANCSSDSLHELTAAVTACISWQQQWQHASADCSSDSLHQLTAAVAACISWLQQQWQPTLIDCSSDNLQSADASWHCCCSQLMHGATAAAIQSAAARGYARKIPLSALFFCEWGAGCWLQVFALCLWTETKLLVGSSTLLKIYFTFQWSVNEYVLYCIWYF